MPELELPYWLLQLIKQWNQEGIKWCFLREPSIIKNDTKHGKDIDIWCRQEDALIMLMLFTKNNWLIHSGTSAGKIVSPPFSAAVRFLPFQSDNKNEKIPIELFIGSLKWHSIIYLTEDIILQNIQKIAPFNFIGGAALQTVLTNRMLLKKSLYGERLKRAQKHYHSLKDHERNDWAMYTAAQFGKKGLLRIEKWLTEKEKPSKKIIYFMLIKFLKKNPNQLLSFSKRTSVLMRRLPCHAKGICIGFIGTDGSGKTTSINTYEQYLSGKNNNTLKKKVVYWGRARGNTALLSFFRNKINKKIENNSNIPNRKFDNNNLITIFAAIAYLIDYWIRYIFQVIPKLMSSEYVLIDRGPLDIATMPGQPNILKKVALAGPSMDLVVLCSAPIDTILSRKQDRTREQVRCQQKIYRELINGNYAGIIIDTVRSCNDNAIIIDTAAQLAYKHKHGKVDREVIKLIDKQIIDQIVTSNN